MHGLHPLEKPRKLIRNVYPIINPGLSCSKFGTSGLSHGQIMLRARLINNKLERGVLSKKKKIFQFSCNYINVIPI